MNLITRAMDKMERRARGDVSLGTLDTAMDLQQAMAYVLSGQTYGVTPERAMCLVPVYSAVSVLSESVAQCPFITYKAISRREKVEAPDHSLSDLLMWQPNPEQTAFEFWEMAVANLALWGNFYAEIERNAYGIVGLWPLRPDRMRIVRDERDELLYLYTVGSESIPRPFPFRDIFHIRGKAVLEAVRGTSPVQFGAEAIGLGAAAERFGSKFFSNDSRPGGILTVAGKLSQEARERLIAGWEKAHRGAENRWRVAVLEEGANWQTIGVPPEQAQFLETRKFQRTEIAALFRVPPHMIGDLERATFSNIEHQSIEFVTYSIEPWTTRIEHAARRDLFRTMAGKRSHMAEFYTDLLKYGDFKTRAEALAIMRQNGALTGNEWRLEVGYSPHADGDVLLVNGNMIPVKQANQAVSSMAPAPGPAAPAEPAAAPDEGDDDGTDGD